MRQYTGAEFKGLQEASSGPPTATKVGLFVFFALARAIHPTIIAVSKEADPETGQKSYPYSTVSVVMGETVVTLIITQLMVLANGGMGEWKAIWRPLPMKVFSFIGFAFALGDYLELASIGRLGGGLLLSKLVVTSKLVITALMMWAIKGTRQTTLQWNFLLLVMLSMSVYMLGDKQCSGTPGGGISIMGVSMVLLKVTVSCFSAVLSDKYMKEYRSEPIYMQLVQIKCGWFAAIFVISLVDGETWQRGFFAGWKGVTVGVLASFAVKSFSTMYLLAILDSVLKSIGEATAVMAIYAAQVILPCFDCPFEFPTFLSVMVVILSVTAYVSSKSVVEKAEKYDQYITAKL